MKMMIFTLSLFMAGYAFACSCRKTPNLHEQYHLSEIVILAKLKKIDTGKFKWEITESIKGENPGNLGIVEKGLTSCALQLEDGQEWLLFLNKNEVPVLDFCGPNRTTEHLYDGWHEDMLKNTKQGKH